MIVCIEGCIGTGKTTLAKRLGKLTTSKLVLEKFHENPFLNQFYENPKAYDLRVQLAFMLLHSEVFNSAVTNVSEDTLVFSDFHPFKTSVFNRLLFKDSLDYDLANQIYSRVSENVVSPDIVVFLTADVNVIHQRIVKRDEEHGWSIGKDYLKRLQAEYHQYFQSYDGRLLRFDTSSNTPESSINSICQAILREIESPRS